MTIADTLSRIPDMLVIFRGEVSREHEGTIIDTLQQNLPEETRRRVAYEYHEATDKRPEERIYLLHSNPALVNQAKFIGDLEHYHGLKTNFAEKAQGIHVPAKGGPYMGEKQLIIEAPAPIKA